VVEDALRDGWARLREGASRPRAGDLGPLLATTAGRWLAIAVACTAVLTLAGLALLWPGDTGLPGSARATGTVPGEVIRVESLPCAAGAQQRCRRGHFSVEGREVTIDLGPARSAPAIGVGDAVRLMRPNGDPRVAPAADARVRYEFVEVDRRSAVLWVCVLAALVAVALLRWRGVLAVIGVALSVLIVVSFVVPAILAGEPALLVALVASLAVMFITLVLTNGVGAQMLAASLGVTATLVLTCLIAVVAVGITHLDGTSDLETLAVNARADAISLRGIILAGMLVGALGVVADTAVTQASAVMALRRTNPGLAAGRLYREALTIGRDHLSATIHTLVLAYAGAALPLLLELELGHVSSLDAVNGQAIAGPIVATVVGCLALICAVPLTTGLSAVMIARVPAHALPHHPHAH
jgi:uncharacterized membrane protein